MTVASRIPAARVAAIFLAASGMMTAAGTHATMAQANPTLTNVIPASEAATIQARITAIDTATRTVTLRGAADRSVSVVAGPAVRLELLKVGDTVNAQYYRSVGFMVVPAQGGNGTPAAPADQVTAVMARPVQAPGGIGVSLTKISGTVVGVDLAAHRIDIVNPSGGGVYTIDVTDPARIAMLSQLGIGDTVTAVISQAVAISIQPAGKSWLQRLL
jgi:hypothetical protein